MYNLEQKTKHGIDKVEIMIEFMSVLECKKGSEKQACNVFEKYLEKTLKRKLTTQEKHDFYQGVLNYLQSESETNKRFKAMDYLFELEFIS